MSDRYGHHQPLTHRQKRNMGIVIALAIGFVVMVLVTQEPTTLTYHQFLLTQ